MGSSEDIFGKWTEEWDLDGYQCVVESKQSPLTEETFEDLERLKWCQNSTDAYDSHKGAWWLQNCSNSAFWWPINDNKPDDLEISSCVTQSGSDGSPTIPLGNDLGDNLEHVFDTCMVQDAPTWNPLWQDDSYFSLMSFSEDASSENGTCVPEEASFYSTASSRKQVESFSLEQLQDLKGSTSAEGRKMTAEERALMLYKRKLRNRNSAARSRRRRTIILNEINGEVSSLKSLIKELQCRLAVYERGGFLNKMDSKFEEIRTNLFTQLERLLAVEYRVAVLRAKLMGTKVKGTSTGKYLWEMKTERSMSLTSV